MAGVDEQHGHEGNDSGSAGDQEHLSFVCRIPDEPSADRSANCPAGYLECDRPCRRRSDRTPTTTARCQPSLLPLERAVYVLREAFSYGHAEIAEILDLTDSASQQHLHRARLRLTAAGGEVDPASARSIVEEFLAAASSGRTERLVALLTDDAIAISDGAGLTERLLQFDTPQRIAAVVRAGFKPTRAKRRFAGGTPAIHYALVNRVPAVLFVVGDHVVGAVTFDITDGKIATVRSIAAPTRISRLTEAWRKHEPDTPLIAQW